MTSKRFDVVFSQRGKIGTYIITVRASDKTTARIIGQDLIRQAEPGVPWTVRDVVPFKEASV